MPPDVCDARGRREPARVATDGSATRRVGTNVNRVGGGRAARPTTSALGARVAFDVGDKVVYPHHGAAVIERRETKVVFGEEREYLVLRLAYGDLTLNVPADNTEGVSELEVTRSVSPTSSLASEAAPYSTSVFSSGGKAPSGSNPSPSTFGFTGWSVGPWTRNAPGIE